MAEVKITRKVPLPYHNEECGMLHTGNAICVPCATKQARLREIFWKLYDEGK